VGVEFPSIPPHIRGEDIGGGGEQGRMRERERR